MEPVAAVQIISYGSTQFHQAGIGRIEGMSLLQRIDTLLANMPGGIKIRLAHTQGDGIRHILDHIEELPDSGWFDIDHFIG